MPIIKSFTNIFFSWKSSLAEKVSMQKHFCWFLTMFHQKNILPLTYFDGLKNFSAIYLLWCPTIFEKEYSKKEETS